MEFAEVYFRKIPVKAVRPRTILPKYAHLGDSGMDVHVHLDAEWTTLKAGTHRKFPLGFALELPPNVEAQIRPRSGLAERGISAICGTIDSTYRGEVHAVLHNFSERDFRISNGDKIAQIVFAPVIYVRLEPVPELSPSLRGENGFGSTGI